MQGYIFLVVRMNQVQTILKAAPMGEAPFGHANVGLWRLYELLFAFAAVGTSSLSSEVQTKRMMHRNNYS